MAGQTQIAGTGLSLSLKTRERIARGIQKHLREQGFAQVEIDSAALIINDITIIGGTR